MSALAPLDRLAPRDFYRQLDWLRDEWEGDEYKVAQKLVRLRKMFEHLPTRYYQRALEEIEIVAHARIVNGVLWPDAIRRLAAIVTEWDESRPALLECEECGLRVQGHRRLLDHRYVVHGIEEVA